MRFICFIFITALFNGLTYSQLGYELDLTRHTYNQKVAPLTPNIPSLDKHSLGVQFGGQYWFRLKNYRLEFIPGLHLGTDLSKKSEFRDYKITNVQFLANFPVLIYPLNFKEDCNCPTFKKSGKVIEKGFHIILQPGIAFNRRNINHDSITVSRSSFTPIIGLGAGMDVGLSRFMTLTPFITYNVYLRDYLGRTEIDKIELEHHSLNAGVRLRLYKNKRRY